MGEKLYREGAQPEELFFITSGRVSDGKIKDVWHNACSNQSVGTLVIFGTDWFFIYTHALLFFYVRVPISNFLGSSLAECMLVGTFS